MLMMVVFCPPYRLPPTLRLPNKTAKMSTVGAESTEKPVEEVKPETTEVRQPLHKLDSRRRPGGSMTGAL